MQHRKRKRVNSQQHYAQQVAAAAKGESGSLTARIRFSKPLFYSNTF